MPFRSITDEQFATADKIVREDGQPVAEAARQTGISAQTLYKRYRPSADPKPGGRRATTHIKKPGPTDEALVDFFSKVGMAPAIPVGLWLHCDFCAAHFVNTGPRAAQQLVELSKDNAQLRQMMEWVYNQWEAVAWGGLLVTWLGVPIAHHAAPDWIYKWLQLPLHLPPRGDVPGPPPHVHTNGNGGHQGEQEMPAFNPFQNLDTETMLAIAKSMGIQIPDFAPVDAGVTDEPIGDDAAAPEASEAPDDASPTEAAPVEADSDADE